MEQDIKILEKMLKTRKEQKEIIECAGGYCGNCNPDIKALENAIQTMKAYKELKENSIPVSLVEEKIEEIDKIYKCIPEDEGNFAKAILIKEKQVLQELLEKRK